MISLIFTSLLIKHCFIPYRGSDFYFTTQSYKANTFNLEDIFDGATVKELKNKTEFAVYETQSILFGMCFTICKLRKVKAFEFSTRCRSHQHFTSAFCGDILLSKN